MRTVFTNTKFDQHKSYNPNFQKLVKFNLSQISYNLRVNKTTMAEKLKAVEEAGKELEPIAKEKDVKIKIISAFQQPFIYVKRKGLKSIVDSIRGISSEDFAEEFKKDNIFQKAVNLIEDLNKKVAGNTGN